MAWLSIDIDQLPRNLLRPSSVPGGRAFDGCQDVVGACRVVQTLRCDPCPDVLGDAALELAA